MWRIRTKVRSPAVVRGYAYIVVSVSIGTARFEGVFFTESYDGLIDNLVVGFFRSFLAVEVNAMEHGKSFVSAVCSLKMEATLLIEGHLCQIVVHIIVVVGENGNNNGSSCTGSRVISFQFFPGFRIVGHQFGLLDVLSLTFVLREGHHQLRIFVYHPPSHQFRGFLSGISVEEKGCSGWLSREVNVLKVA